MLEVIEKGQLSPKHPHAVLFVLGAWHGGWCWDEHFLDFFAERGFHVLAPSLRGHGSNTLAKSVRTCSISVGKPESNRGQPRRRQLIVEDAVGRIRSVVCRFAWRLPCAADRRRASSGASW